MVLELSESIPCTDLSSQIVLPDPTISNIHLRVYSIRYDPGVEPFVYVENLSTNGVNWVHERCMTWGGFPILQGEAILLSNGDKLHLCDHATFTFQTRLSASQLLTSTQLQEQEDPDCRQVLEKAVSASLGLFDYR